MQCVVAVLVGWLLLFLFYLLLPFPYILAIFVAFVVERVSLLFLRFFSLFLLSVLRLIHRVLCFGRVVVVLVVVISRVCFKNVYLTQKIKIKNNYT